MAIIFKNKSQIDPRAWSIMGMSAKDKNNENPIGKYGTGLKHSIAVLLREGHKIKIHSNGKEYKFSTRKDEFRGKEFDLILCNDSELPFTTDLGKNWKIWQAYRELLCNSLDENGSVEIWDKKKPIETAVIVEGEEFQRVYENKENFFTDDSRALEVGELISIHPGEGKFFHRGNLAGEDYNTVFNYDFKKDLDLTEDRTLVPNFSLKYFLGSEVVKLKDRKIIEKILLAPSDSFEAGIHWSHHFSNISEEFKEVAVSLYKSKASDISYYLRAAIIEYLPDLGLENLQMSEVQLNMLAGAQSILNKMGYNISEKEIYLVEDQENSLAFAFQGKIYLTSRAFESKLSLAKIMFEEWAHVEFKYSDCSRDFQNYLIDQVFAQYLDKVI